MLLTKDALNAVCDFAETVIRSSTMWKGYKAVPSRASGTNVRCLYTVLENSIKLE